MYVPVAGSAGTENLQITIKMYSVVNDDRSQMTDDMSVTVLPVGSCCF